MTVTETRAKSAEAFAEARRVIPGGVNSPVRAFRSVGGDPVFIERGSGSRLTDVDAVFREDRNRSAKFRHDAGRSERIAKDIRRHRQSAGGRADRD